MGLDNDDSDQVGEVTRKANAATAVNLMRTIFGSDTTTNNAQNISSTKTQKANIVADAKKKKKDESEQREAFKRAQEALERHLEELQRQIEAIKKQIVEAKKAILDVEEQLRKKYGDNWEEKFRKGEADKNDRLYKEWLQKYERLDELEKQYKELNEKLDEVRRKRDQIEADHTSSPQQKAEKIEQLARDVEAVTLREARTWEDTKGPKTSGLTLSESANPLQEKLTQGNELAVEVLEVEETKVLDGSADFLAVPAAASIAANLDGGGSYKKSVGKEGLSSREAFTTASNNAGKELLPKQEVAQGLKADVKPSTIEAKA